MTQINTSDATAQPPSADDRAWLQYLDAALKAASPGHYDELRMPNGSLREPWEDFFATLGKDGLMRLPEAAKTVERVIEQNGITYNVFVDKQDLARPWSLNPIPMLIGAQEWQHIQASLSQRAKLLNKLVHDVYHERHLLSGAYLPSALVLGNPGYLHAMHQVDVPNDIYLHVVAFDLARDPHGQWWVIGQRTQSPSGLGYVLENRLIISRLFPQAYRDLRVQHLGASYRRLLTTLELQAQSIANGPVRFAFLTSGPYSETYFEHAYLARYLGIPLVEGPDLTVRNNEVFLKTVHGLQRIHGLVRRLDDDFCDSLELRTDSAIGVPGLLQAIRARKVVVANALGTGFLESPAIQGFLPSICEYMLNETLLMPSLHTWWCGETAAWQDVNPRLDSQVIKPTFANRQSTNFEPVIASLLDRDACDQWRARIGRQPDIYTTQTYLPFSQVPTFDGQMLEPKTAMMRFYALIGQDNEWHVLPGGMTRVAALDPHIVSIRGGGSTLDTWVISDGEVETFSMLPKNTAVERWRTNNELVSSRLAENLFWLGRYTERAEAMVRLAREALMLLSTNRVESLSTLNQAITDLAKFQNLVPFDSPSMSASPATFGSMLVRRLKDNSSGGLMDVVQSMQIAMRSVRDRLPAEHAEVPARVKSALLQEDTHHDMMRALEQVELPLAALVGYQLDRMTKDLGWRLLAAGRLLERLINQSQMITEFFGSAAVYTAQGFDSLLTLFDSAITYRTRYQQQQDIFALLDLIVLDEANPRALKASIAELIKQLSYLPDHERIVKLLPNFDRLKDSTTAILDLVKETTDVGIHVSDVISRQFFVHAAEQRFSS
jgi:uncharacterized circularly permuted ATP-grasp superfamily protein/uncharacterized alpha-E superfamily protein